MNPFISNEKNKTHDHKTPNIIGYNVRYQDHITLLFFMFLLVIYECKCLYINSYSFDKHTRIVKRIT